MKLNKKSQYGMLLVLYICRAGRTTIESAADSLRLSRSFLEQVARKLRQAGVIQSVKGPGGGYELVDDPTVVDVLDALSPLNFLTSEERKEYRSGTSEKRAFLAYVSTMQQGLSPLLRRRVRNLNNQLVVDELAAMNRADEASPV